MGLKILRERYFLSLIIIRCEKLNHILKMMTTICDIRKYTLAELLKSRKTEGHKLTCVTQKDLAKFLAKECKFLDFRTILDS